MSIRPLASSISTWLFAFLLCMFIATSGLLLVLTSPTKMKDVIDQSGLYQTFVTGILEQSQQQTPSLNDPIDTIPLDRPEIQAAIHTAFPPYYLRQQGQIVIDALYIWLQGKSAVPDFRINLTTAKATFALAMGNYIQKRLSTLPTCTLATSQATFDAFNTPCVPSGFDVTNEVHKVELEVATSSTFLPSPIVTANAFTSSGGQPLFTQLRQLPQYYQSALRLPYIFGTLTLIAAIIEIVSNVDKRKGTRRLGTVLFGAGLFFVVTSWLFNSLFQHFTTSLNAQANSGFFTQRFTLVFDQADKAVNLEYLILGALCAILGGVILLIANLLHFHFEPTTVTDPMLDIPPKIKSPEPP